MKKLVLTGASGKLGSHLREPLAKMCDAIVSTDIADPPETLLPNETFVQADLADLDKMIALLEGAEMVVHFGAIGDEQPFEQLLGPNILGAYNIWEAAHRNGVRRVIYASSIHAVGMYDKSAFIGTEVPHRPDTYYGLTKCFAEDLARLCWDKRGIEAVCLRILSCARVTNPRAVGTWLSYDDLIQLVQRSIEAPVTGFSVVYGVSNNDRAPVDNSAASHLGYRPKDNAEQFAAKIFAAAGEIDVRDPANTRHGGPFAAVDLGSSGMAHLNLNPDESENP